LIPSGPGSGRRWREFPDSREIFRSKGVAGDHLIASPQASVSLCRMEVRITLWSLEWWYIPIIPAGFFFFFVVVVVVLGIEPKASVLLAKQVLC
jgi:hypothetical protein